MYSRESQPVRARVEKILGDIEGGKNKQLYFLFTFLFGFDKCVLLCLATWPATCAGHAVTYSTGMSAVFAAFAHIVPKRVIMAPGGYFVTHKVVEMFTKFNGMVLVPLIMQLTRKSWHLLT